MSPEVLLEQAPDGRADIFSLGVVFYEVLTGQHPFMAGSFVPLPTAFAGRLRPPFVFSIVRCRRIWMRWSTRRWPKMQGSVMPALRICWRLCDRSTAA